MSGILEATLWGFIGASALILGALLAFAVDIPIRVRGLIQGFGAGVLFGAVAYELVEEAVKQHAGGFAVGIGFGLGGLVFFVGSVLIDSMGSSGGDPDAGAPAAADGSPGLEGVDYDRLTQRADEQRDRIEVLRLEAARSALV